MDILRCNIVRCKKTRNNCFWLEKHIMTLLQAKVNKQECYKKCTLMLFSRVEESCDFFLPETTATSFLHFIVCICKVFIDHRPRNIPSPTDMGTEGSERSNTPSLPGNGQSLRTIVITVPPQTPPYSQPADSVRGNRSRRQSL